MTWLLVPAHPLPALCGGAGREEEEGAYHLHGDPMRSRNYCRLHFAVSKLKHSEDTHLEIRPSVVAELRPQTLTVGSSIYVLTHFSSYTWLLTHA